MIKTESEKHKTLVRCLISYIDNQPNCKVKTADLEGYDQPEIIENKSKVGDKEDKIPDILAYDSVNQQHIVGESKTGDGDLQTEHTKTQLLLFSRLSSGNKPCRLLVNVPEEKITDLRKLMCDLGLHKNNNVVLLKTPLT